MTGVASPHEDPPAARDLTGPWVVALTTWNLAVFLAWLVVPFVLARSATWLAGWLHLGVIVIGSTAETAPEDSTLRRELPGYQDYCRRTRFRLLPGIW
jgi:protein-S-isoprenylcysteine O-methyltransferase Ste14